MKMRQRHPDSRNGFTLIEVMVALLVLALAMSALQLRIGQTIDSAAYVRDKTIAQWVALNQLELLRVAARFGNPPPEQQLTGTATMAGRTWYWVITPQLPTGITLGETPINSPAMLAIAVSAEDFDAALASPLVNLTGVMDAWHGR